MYTKHELRIIRNDLPMAFTLKLLKHKGLYSKQIEGYLRFICPNCNQLRTTINPKNNLSHCFACKTNYNNIDLMMTQGYSFKQSIKILKDLYKQYSYEL